MIFCTIKDPGTVLVCPVVKVVVARGVERTTRSNDRVPTREGFRWRGRKRGDDSGKGTRVLLVYFMQLERIMCMCVSTYISA